MGRQIAIEYTAAEKAALNVLQQRFDQAKRDYHSGKGDEARAYRNMRQAAEHVLRFRAAVEARCAGKPKPKPVTAAAVNNFMR